MALKTQRKAFKYLWLLRILSVREMAGGPRKKLRSDSRPEETVFERYERLERFRKVHGETRCVLGSEAEAQQGSPAKPKNSPTADLVAKQLNRIDSETAEHYDSWIQVGKAVYGALDGSDAGKELWREWSNRSEKFSDHAINSRWNRFNEALRAHQDRKVRAVMV